jgi:cytochrome c-type biogenesis protein CcmE
MSKRTIRIALSTAVVLVALGGLMSLSLGETAAYYKHVDEVMAAPDEWYGKNLQLHGHVVDQSILRRPNTLEYRFQIHANGKMVQASYTGIVPDTFKSGSEVVLKGRLTEAGFHVEPDGVMAKCPSKYEAAPASAVPGGPASAGKPAYSGGSR